MSTTWMTDDTTRVELVPHEWQAPDGQEVDKPGALVIAEDNTLVIEGDIAGLQRFTQRASRCVQPHRHADLERQVGRARAAAHHGSSEVEIERLKEALDVALTILGREDLR